MTTKLGTIIALCVVIGGVMIIKLIALAGLTLMILAVIILFVCVMSKSNGHKFLFWRD